MKVTKKKKIMDYPICFLTWKMVAQVADAG